MSVRRAIARGNRTDTASLRAGALAGLAAGAAFAAVMKLDIAASGRRVDDFQLLAGFGPLRRRWPIVGAIVHTVNGILLGAVYSRVEPLLRGPGWARGLTFAIAENTILWPIVLLIDRVHPAVRSGEMESFNQPWAFFVENLRHAAYGLTLGVVYERRRRTN